MIDFIKSKAKLESKLHELKERAEKIDADLREPGDDDWEEQAIESSNDEVLEEIGDVTMEEIAQIKLALAQIESGTYGICSQCGEEIAEVRMEIMPHATICVKCA